MASKNIGIHTQDNARVNVDGPVNIDQSKNTANITNSFNKTFFLQQESKDKNVRVGTFPAHFNNLIPQVLRQHHLQGLDDFKKRFHSPSQENKQKLFVIHGPASFGKSTCAQIYVNGERSSFVNRIRIKADTIESLEQDFRLLHKTIKRLQSQDPFPDNEPMTILLTWLYRHVLVHPTVLIFDGAVALDFDPNSVLKDVYNLVAYLPAEDLLVSENLKPPTVVVTTRILLDTNSPVFQVEVVQPFAVGASDGFTNGESLLQQLQADFELLSKFRDSRLAAFLFAVMAYVAPEFILVDLLVHLYCQCPQVTEFLQPRFKPKPEDVEKALKLLHQFSIITFADESNSVRLPRPVASTAAQLRTSLFPYSMGLEKTLVEGVSYMVSEQAYNSKPWNSSKKSGLKNYDMDLPEIAMWNMQLNFLIKALYPDMLKLYNSKIPVSTSIEFLTFAVQGNSYEVQYKLISKVLFEDLTLPPSLKTFIEIELRVVSLLLGNCSQEVLKFKDKERPFTPLIHRVMSGDYQEAIEGYQKSRFKPGDTDSTTIFHSLCIAECHFKLGQHKEASEVLAVLKKPMSSFPCSNHFYSVLPPEVIDASLLSSNSEPEKARQLLKTALLFNREEHGLHSPQTVAVKYYLSKIEASNGAFSEALALIDHVILVRRRFMGVTTVRYIKAVATKAKILTLRGTEYYAEAAKCLKVARCGFAAKFDLYKSVGKDEIHPHCLILRYYQAKISGMQKRFEDALAETKSILKDIEDEYSFSNTLEQLTDTNHYRQKLELLQRTLVLRNNGPKIQNPFFGHRNNCAK